MITPLVEAATVVGPVTVAPLAGLVIVETTVVLAAAPTASSRPPPPWKMLSNEKPVGSVKADM
ncbi:MAG: hypothetical protein AUH30_01160 [Candidatus Rokubacteria bacterium 13_1_40CM_68_15]|nr:MAG: hypothetical protein AUH30_01160 [Candidatus Rokubacteria bacterium 13_1_40CM_68_15]